MDLFLPPLSSPRIPSPVPQNRKGLGFTLVELLAVVAVTAMMATLAVPALSSINKTSQMNRAVTGLSLAIEQARAYAMANNTYVRVGLFSSTDESRVTLATITASGGAMADFQTSTRYQPMNRPQQFENVALLEENIPALAEMPSDATDLSTSQLGSFQAVAGGTNTSFDHVIQFGPSGEAVIGTPSQPRWLQLAIASTPESQSGNCAVLQVSGLTGQVRIFRP